MNQHLLLKSLEDNLKLLISIEKYELCSGLQLRVNELKFEAKEDKLMSYDKQLNQFITL